MTTLRIQLAAALALAAAGTLNAETATSSPADGKPDLSILYDSAFGPNFRYVHGGPGFKAFKPYLNKLRSLTGVNPLRDNVADHIHHHGLMFAVAVDGVDFWSETKKCGRQIQPESSFCTREARLSDNRVRRAMGFTGKINWIKPDGNTVIATEERTLEDWSRLMLPPTLVSWRTQLAPPAGAKSIKLTGSHYFGLGMRFVKSMDNASTFTFADPNAASLKVRGDEKLTPSAWAACTGAVDGNTVTVAMFDHPENPRPALWFTMGKPFSYLSATINLWKEPMVIKAGEELDVCYGIAVWDGKATREQIEEACRNWRELAPALKPAKKDKQQSTEKSE